MQVTILYLAFMKNPVVVACALLFLTSNFTSAQTWKNYPYAPQGSLITFPADEGWHPSEPVEWWYTCGHLTGDSTGNSYSYMLTSTEPQVDMKGFPAGIYFVKIGETVLKLVKE